VDSETVMDMLRQTAEFITQTERGRCARIVETWAGMAEATGNLDEARRFRQAAEEIRRG
jgi:hypothetical protein